jgi:hypothetical protein
MIKPNSAMSRDDRALYLTGSEVPSTTASIKETARPAVR